MNYVKNAIKYYSIFIIIGIVAITLSYLGYNKPLCLFYIRFKIPCPACGTTRAFLSLLSFNIKNAFFYHPLFWMTPFVPLFIAAKNIKYTYIIGFLYISVWVIRIITTYPTFY